MADYHIYLHSVGGVNGGGSSSNTKPKKNQSNTEVDINFDDEKIQGAGFAAIVKAVPWLAVVIAAIKLTDKAITTIEPFVSRATGDYAFGIGYSNMKQTFHAVINPIGTFMNKARAEQAYYLAEQRKEQERQLLGDSVINRFGDYTL